MTEPFKTFTCSYPFNGSHWGLDLKAQDRAEAELRLKALAWAKVDGEVGMIIPAEELAFTMKPAGAQRDPIENAFLMLANGVFRVLNGYVKGRNWLLERIWI